MRKDYGMLGELGLEVGDVLEGRHGEALVQYGNGKGCWMDRLCAVDSFGFMHCDNMSEDWYYQVISRANPKPNIKTGILSQKIGKIEITSNGKIWMQHVSTSKDLDSAIVTLQAISEKLKELNQ